MDWTPFAGLTQLQPGDPIASDGGSFLYRNPAITDHFVRIGAVAHRHDAHPSVPNPQAPMTGVAVGSGGSLAADTQFAFTYTVVDQDGGETLGASGLVISTGGATDTPTIAPSATVDYTQGIMPAGIYYYAMTYTDGQGGETIMGPYVAVTIQPGHASGSVDLSGLATELVANGGLAVNWRLWRSDDASDWHLVLQGDVDTYVDTGFDPPDNPAVPPNVNTTGQVWSLLVTLPTSDEEPVMASGSSVNVYLGPDTGFANPSLYQAGIPLPAAEGMTLVVTQDAVTDGNPPHVTSSIPGAHQIFPDTELQFGLKEPVTGSGALPVGVHGDVRLAEDTEHLWAVIGPSATAPADWTDITQAWINAAVAEAEQEAQTPGVVVAGPGAGSSWQEVARFDAGSPLKPTGLATGGGNDGQPETSPYVNNPLVIPSTVEPGDLMLLGVSRYGGGFGLPGWDVVASAATRGEGIAHSTTLLSRIATEDDIGVHVSISNDVAWAATFRSYKSAGIDDVVVTSTMPEIGGDPSTYQQVNAGDPVQVDFIGVTFQQFVQAPNPLEPGDATFNLTWQAGGFTGTNEEWGGYNLVQQFSDEHFGAVGTEAIGVQYGFGEGVTWKDISAASTDPQLLVVGVHIAVTLLPPPADPGIGTISDFAIPAGEAAMEVTNGLLTTTDPMQVRIYSVNNDNAAPYAASGDKYAAQWTQPGMVGDKTRLRARVVWGHSGSPGDNRDPGGDPIVGAVVVNMVDRSTGLAFWFTQVNAGWTTNLDLLGDVQYQAYGSGNTYGQDFDTLESTQTMGGAENLTDPSDFWVEVTRDGNTITGALYNSNPALGPDVRPAAFSTYDVTGNPSYGPSVAGYYGITFDYLGDQHEGIAELTLSDLVSGELVLPWTRGLDFVGEDGISIEVVDLAGTMRDDDLGGFAAQVIISGSGGGGGSGGTGQRGTDWHIYYGSGAPAPGQFAGELNGDLALRTSDGEVFELVAGDWVDQDFALAGPPGTGSGATSFVASGGTGSGTVTSELDFVGDGPTVEVTDEGGGRVLVTISSPWKAPIPSGGSLPTGATPTIDTIDVVGHSYATGYGLSSPATERATAVLAAALGTTETVNDAVGGAALTGDHLAQGGWVTVFNDFIPTGAAPYNKQFDLGVAWYSFNDLAELSAAWNSSDQTLYQHALRAVISRLSAAHVYDNTDASVTYAGMSSNPAGTDFGTGPTNEVTSSSGTATIAVPADFPGGTVAVYVLGFTTAASDWTFTVDGAAAGSIDTSIADPIQRSGASNAFIFCKRFTDLAPGAHTIVGSVSVSAFQGWFDSWAIEAQTPPYILVPGQFKLSNYGLYSSSPHEPTDADVAALNAITESVVAEFPSEVLYVDLSSLDYTTELQSDNVHPTAALDETIAALMQAALPSGGPVEEGEMRVMLADYSCWIYHDGAWHQLAM